jgi:hypothetical protein
MVVHLEGSQKVRVRVPVGSENCCSISKFLKWTVTNSCNQTVLKKLLLCFRVQIYTFVNFSHFCHPLLWYFSTSSGHTCKRPRPTRGTPICYQRVYFSISVPPFATGLVKKFFRKNFFLQDYLFFTFNMKIWIF